MKKIKGQELKKLKNKSDILSIFDQYLVKYNSGISFSKLSSELKENKNRNDN